MKRFDCMLDADELEPIIQVLQDALTQRPNPEGEPHCDLQSALETCDEYFQGIQNLLEASQMLSAYDLMRAAAAMSSGYTRLWERPFPEGLEAGQILFSAAMERPMRDLLRLLRSLPESAYATSPGKPLTVLDAEDELKCFSAWLDELPAQHSLGVRPSQENRTGAIAASFLLGWWLGRD